MRTTKDRHLRIAITIEQSVLAQLKELGIANRSRLIEQLLQKWLEEQNTK